MFELSIDPIQPIEWGPSGELVYERTYARTKPNGELETWPETCMRVAEGNMQFLLPNKDEWTNETFQEVQDIYERLLDFRMLPGGRHLWSTGVSGRQFPANCFSAGHGDRGRLSDHFVFQFMRQMEGGGVGANYSEDYTGFPSVTQSLEVHIVCDPSHPDYEAMKKAGVLSDKFSDDWHGCYQIEDSREGWANALGDLLDTYQRDDVKHKDRVYDVSIIRHKGAKLKSFGGTASGPEPLAEMLLEVQRVLNKCHENGGAVRPLDLMDIDHYVAKCTVAGGVRRAARMSILHWNDPSIFEFINCKSDPSKHWTTNISVEIDSDFLEALSNPLHSTLDHATYVFQAVVNGMLENGEPGFFNSTLANQGELEKIRCTNPCAEITLNDWESCIIGHVNLAKFDELEDEEDLEYTHRLMTRFLIRASFAETADERQKSVVDRNRRIGVGHFGVQEYLVRNGSSITREAEAFASGRDTNFSIMLTQLGEWVDEEAKNYAFNLRIPAPIKTRTVAPTGSIAKLPGVSEGIHPIFSPFFERRIRFNPSNDNQSKQILEMWNQGYEIEDDIYDKNMVVAVIPTKDPLVDIAAETGGVVEGADEISIDNMLAWQALYQEAWADNAVSFTANLPANASKVDLKTALKKWLPYLKGTTVFPHNSRPQSPYTKITEEEFNAAKAKQVADSVDVDCSRGGCPVGGNPDARD